MKRHWIGGRQTEVLSILPLRNSVLFPASVVPVNVGRFRSIRLIDQALAADRATIGVVAQRVGEVEDPDFDGVYWVGTIARVLKVIRLNSGNYSVVLQGIARMRILEPLEREPCMRASMERLVDVPARDEEVDALSAHVRESTRTLLSVMPQMPREANAVVENVREPGALSDLIASNLPIGVVSKQAVLETLDVRQRLRKVSELVNRQIEVYRVKKQISTTVQEDMSRSQREILLRQQLKSIRQELGEGDEEDEVEALKERVMHAELSPEAEKAARKQLNRMRSMPQSSSEYQVSRTYVECLVDYPWSRSTPDRLDVAEVRRVLDEDHHGLEPIKKRILEYIAVRKLRQDKRGPILCFLGPPGVGKTSLARSISRGIGRQFVRMALGGVHDEAEIRGHRRTYVGSLPGRIVASMRKAQSRNPVMLLDEIDKLGSDHRGDPASALLEVLDPEQNNAFVDHYLEVPVDLSQVMFIATANRYDTIPRPLLDRMEVIDIAGYTLDEKRSIAKQFVIPRQLSDHGLTPERLEFPDASIDMLIDEYTKEAGVRHLTQQVASLCRSVAVRVAHGEDVHSLAEEPLIHQVLGPPRFEKKSAEAVLSPGVSAGLAWTPTGADLLYVEASRMPGTGQLHLTGKVGKVLREAVATALTYLRTRAHLVGQPSDFMSNIDIHIHIARASSSADSASAGVAVLVALASMLTGLRVRSGVAMTGEMTLQGRVLQVEGIKEKCLAAHRAGMHTVVLPARNAADLEQVPEAIRSQLHVHLVSKVDEVIPLVLDITSELSWPTSPMSSSLSPPSGDASMLGVQSAE